MPAARIGADQRVPTRALEDIDRIESRLVRTFVLANFTACFTAGLLGFMAGSLA
jgi:hypothetical protein